MKIKEVKEALKKMNEVRFMLDNGESVPSHYHITEVGVIEKHFVDCGGIERKERLINFQLWTASDYDHRMDAQKLLSILEIAERTLQYGNFEVEVEYQQSTIGKYELDVEEGNFKLVPTYANCLSPDKCGIPAEKPRMSMSELSARKNQCNLDSGCC